MEDFKNELEQNWKKGLEAIDSEAKELRKEEKKNDMPCRILKWLSS